MCILKVENLALVHGTVYNLVGTPIYCRFVVMQGDVRPLNKPFWALGQKAHSPKM